MNDFFSFVFESIEDLRTFGMGKFFAIFFAVVLIILGAGSYYTYNSTASLLKKIKTLEAQLEDVKALKNLSENISLIEKDEQAFLTTNSLPTGGLKAFLEQKLTAASLTAEAGWKEKAKVNPWFLDSLFEEERVTLEFKSITTKQLVEFVQLLYSQPAVALRELDVNLKDDALAVVLLVSYRYKKS